MLQPEFQRGSFIVHNGRRSKHQAARLRLSASTPARGNSIWSSTEAAAAAAALAAAGSAPEDAARRRKAGAVHRPRHRLPRLPLHRRQLVEAHSAAQRAQLTPEVVHPQLPSILGDGAIVLRVVWGGRQPGLGWAWGGSHGQPA